ncbi:MAG TPA: choice-of-anchor J domain-containing protein [Bacteroidia bacterium]|nr:choice-of-anchor J domain-containing protein [Bacteroidia bacterium]HNU33021.1 choice-of-anchor J domain-containing protein [Bacteroidia bacterium]
MKKFTLLSAIGIIASQALIAQGDRVGQQNTSVFGARSQTTFATPNGSSSLKNGLSFINVSYVDDFEGDNSVLGLVTRGYTVERVGTGPIGTTEEFFQGNPATFVAYNGSDSSYVAANYNTVASGDIDNWLITPPQNVAAGDVISFYSKAPTGSIYPDSIRVMYSATGALTNADPSWVELGRFAVTIGATWAQSVYSVTSGGATATFAIRYAVVDGGPLGANSNYIGIDQLEIATPAAVDGGVTSINGLVSGCGLSATTAIEITIANNGGSALSNFPVSYSINGGTPVNETYTGTINAGATANYTFTQTADLSAVNTFNITATTAITGDGNAANDASNTSVTNTAPVSVTLGAPFNEGFETATTTPPAGWATFDVDADGNNWDFPTTYPHTGSVCARVGFPAGTAAVVCENWLISPCFDLVAGTNYVLKYYYKAFDVTGNPYQLETRYGSIQDPSGMTNNIAIEAQPIDTTYQFASYPINVAANGIYYFGFNLFGTNPTFSTRVDDISLEVVTSVSNPDGSDLFFVYPNPSSSYLTISSQIQESNLTVSIYNVTGQEVYSTVLAKATKQDIDVSNLASGVYTIKVKGEKSNFTKKLVIE